MSPTVLHLVRHGESAGNVNPGLRRSDDPPLTDRGRDQAARAAAALARIGLEAVYSSPLRRARETAEVVNGSITVLREDDGQLQLVSWCDAGHLA